MNTPADQVRQVVDECRVLLSRTTWQPHERLYLEGQYVSIMLNSCLSQVQGRYDVPVVVLALQLPQAALSGMTVLLQREDDVMVYGTLSEHGQVIFRALEPQNYQISVIRVAAVHNNHQQMLPYPLIALPPIDLNRRLACAEGDTTWQQRYRNEAGTLTATLRLQDTGELICILETPLRAWDGQVFGVEWQPDETDPAELLLAPLVWSERLGAAVGHVFLGGGVGSSGVLTLPAQPLGRGQLAQLSAEVLRRSVEQAGSALTQRGWRQLASGDALPQALQQVVREALEPC